MGGYTAMLAVAMCEFAPRPPARGQRPGRPCATPGRIDPDRHRCHHFVSLHSRALTTGGAGLVQMTRVGPLWCHTRSDPTGWHLVASQNHCSADGS
jgi:hypothetical protein